MSEISRIKVVFSIFSENGLDHSLITQIIGIEPTDCWSKGDVIRKKLKRKESAWTLSTDYIDTNFLEDVLEIIINKIKSQVPLLSEIIIQKSYNCKFFIVVEPTEMCFPSLYLSKEFIEICYMLGAEIDTDVLI